MHKGVFALLVAALSAAPLSAQGRLFAVDYVIPQVPEAAGGYSAAPGASPLGLFGNIYELDPLTGAQLNQFDAPEYTTGPEGLAFDGTSLWFVSAPIVEMGPEGGLGPSGTLYELDPDTGAVLDADVHAVLAIADGLGALNGLLYAMDYEADVVYIFDPATDGLIGSIDVGAANPLRDFIGGLDGYEEGNLLMATADVLAGVGEGGTSHLRVFLDPVTGAEVDSFPLGGDFDAGVAALGTTIYTGEYDLAGGIDLYDPNGTLLDTFAVPYGVSGLAAGGVEPPSEIEVPAISPAGAALLALALFAAAAVSLRRRRA
jgi:hypothetical protein